MQLNVEKIEHLLNQEEGPTLDFKKAQYKFKKIPSREATEKHRSQLVKDLLAFANTKRETSAYILIGVEEVIGGRSKILGVSEHLRDDEIHDFMNRRTQRPIEFSYIPYRIDGFNIGVIEIPVQERLFFLTKSYGNLHENAVYIRDGSSTRTANPHEIAEMLTPKTPSFELKFIDPHKNGAISLPCEVHSLVLNPVLALDDIQTTGPPRSHYPIPVLEEHNPNYPAELIFYTYCKNLLQPLRLHIRNTSDVTGKRVQLEASVMKRQYVLVMNDLPEFPEEYSNPLSHSRLPNIYHRDDIAIRLSEDNESWRILVEFENIRPGEEISTDDELWFGSAISQEFTISGKVLGENIPNPIPCSLLIKFESQQRPMTLQDTELAKER